MIPDKENTIGDNQARFSACEIKKKTYFNQFIDHQKTENHFKYILKYVIK